MKPRNTLLLLIIAGSLLAYLALVDRNQLTTREADARKYQVVDFDPEKIERIVLTNNEERIELSKRQGQWLLTAPIQDKADAGLAQTLLDDTLSLRPYAVLNESRNEVDVKSFGVTKSAVRLQLFGEGAPPEISFGKNAAVDGQIYIALAGSNRVYVVPADLKNLVAKKTDDYRDRSLVVLPPDQVGRMTIQSSEGEIDLRRQNEHWQIIKPIQARANDPLIGKLISQIIKLQAKGFVGEKEQALLGEPFGTVSLYTESSQAPVRLSVLEPPTDHDRLYAKLSTRNSVFVLERVVAGLFKAKPNDLRDPHLLRLNFDMVDRIAIQPSGKPRTLLARHGEKWSIDDHPIDSKKVTDFVDYLLKLKVVTFVSDTASDLEKYGLREPLVKISFIAYSSENTPESKAGERQIVSLHLGRVENGEIFAKLEEEPFVVSIDKGILDRIPEAAKWRAGAGK